MLHDVFLDPELTLEQKGLFTLFSVLAARGEPLSITNVVARSGLSAKTVRGHLKVLEAKGFISVVTSAQDRRERVVLPVGSNEERCGAMIKAIIRRIAQARSRIRDEGSKESIGETLMKEWLNLLIALNIYTDNARPGFLINPLSGDVLEYDRWYPTARLAFEFQGPHHFRTTTLQADPDALARQVTNDLVKLGLSQRNGITLVEVHPADLRLDRVLKLIPPGTPLRPLHGLEKVIRFLEEECAKYRRQFGVRG